MYKFREILLIVLVVLGFSTNCVAQQCEDFEGYTANTSASSTSNSTLVSDISGWSVTFSGSSGYTPHVYKGSSNVNGKGIVLSAKSGSSSNTSTVITPYDLSQGKAVKYTAKGSTTGTLYMGYYNGSSFTRIADANVGGVNYYNIFEGNNIPSGAKLAFQYYQESSASYYSVYLDDICLIEPGHQVDPCGDGTGDDFSGWYATTKVEKDSGLPRGWSRRSGAGGRTPHVYTGNATYVNGNGIVMSAKSGSSTNTSIVITPYVMSQGKAVQYTVKGSETGTFSMGYYYNSNFTSIAVANVGEVNYYNIFEDYNIPSGAKLAFQYYQETSASYYSVYLDDICVIDPGSVVEGGNGCDDFSGWYATTEVNKDSGLPRGWSRRWSGEGGRAPHVYTGNATYVNGNGIVMSAKSGSSTNTSIVITPYVMSQGKAVQYTVKGSETGTFSMGYYYNSNFTSIAVANVGEVNYYNIFEDYNIPSGAKLAFQYYQETSASYYSVYLDDICVIDPGSVVEGGNGCDDFSGWYATTEVNKDSGLPRGWSRRWSGEGGRAPHVYTGNATYVNGNGIVMSAKSGSSTNTSIVITPYVMSQGKAVQYTVKGSETGTFSMGYYYNSNFTSIAVANVGEVNYYNIFEDYNIPSGAKLAFQYYQETSASYYSVYLDDICVIDPGSVVEGGNGCDDFSGWYATTEVNKDSGLPRGWSRRWSGEGGRAPHVYTGNATYVNGNGIVMSAKSGSSTNTSIVITPYVMSQGKAVQYTVKGSGTGTFSMGYYYNSNFTAIATANVGVVNYYNIFEDINIPSGAKLAFRYYQESSASYYSVYLDDICVIEPGSAVDGSGNGCDEFTGWYATTEVDKDSGLPIGWSRKWSGEGGRAPHVYTGNSTYVNGNGIVMSAKSGSSTNTSIVISPYALSQGKTVTYKAKGSSTGTLYMGYYNGSGFTPIATAQVGRENSHNISENIPSGAKLAFKYYQESSPSYYSVYLDDICVIGPWEISWDLTNCSVEPQQDFVSRGGHSLETTITVGDGIGLPGEIIITKANGEILGENEYSWNPSTGELVVPNVSGDLSVSVCAKPYVMTLSGNLLVCKGEPISMTAKGGAPDGSFQWGKGIQHYISGSNISGATSDTYSTADFEQGQYFWVSRIGTNSCGMPAKSFGKFKASYADIEDPTVAGAYICQGSTATLVATNAGRSPIYNWYGDAGCTTAVKTNSSSFTTPSLYEDTKYYIKASDESVGSYEYSYDFEYTGSEQIIPVPAGVKKVKLEVWGAQGGNSICNGRDTYSGGKGGYSVVETDNLTAGTELHIYVGGKGTDAVVRSNSNGGYNGGGLGTWDNNDDEAAGGGGGATHIATVGGLLYKLEAQKSAVLVVAGGGAGTGWSYIGGYGGGETSGTCGSSTSATQTSGYAFGRGQDASGTGDGDGVSGGGGGWYGGVMGGYKYSGSGGSGYITSSRISGQTIAGNQEFSAPDGSTETGHSGNGYARVTFYYEAKKTCMSEPKEVNVVVNTVEASFSVSDQTICANATATLTTGGVSANWYDNSSCTTLLKSNSASYTTDELSSNRSYYVTSMGNYSKQYEEIYEFDYTGNIQMVNVPNGADSVKLEVWGAQGGRGWGNSNYLTNTVGKGGYTQATFAVTSGETLYVVVGGQGSDAVLADGVKQSAPGGFNGGGNGSSDNESLYRDNGDIRVDAEASAGGGGATHIAKKTGLLSDFVTAADRQKVLVVAGAGGGGSFSQFGGYGGGVNGGQGDNDGGVGGGQTGAEQLFGRGENGNSKGFGNGVAGGGAGWYGGKVNPSESGDNNAAGGGSGYLSASKISGQTIAGNQEFPAPDGSRETGHSGNGYARVTFYCTASGSCMSQPVTVNVAVDKPDRPTSTSDSENRYCGASNATFSASVPDGYSIDWYDAATGGNKVLENSASYTVNNLDVTKTFYAQARSLSTTCVSSERLPVESIISYVTASLQTNTSSLCLGGTATITADGGEMYKWSTGGDYSDANYISVSPISNTTYTVTATDNGTCIATATISQQVQQAPGNVPQERCYGYIWTGRENDDWNNKNNWLTFSNANGYRLAESVPQQTEDVIIRSGDVCIDHNPVVTSQSIANNVIIREGRTLSFVDNQNLSIKGNLIIENGATLNTANGKITFKGAEDQNIVTPNNASLTFNNIAFEQVVNASGSIPKINLPSSGIVIDGEAEFSIGIANGNVEFTSSGTISNADGKKPNNLSFVDGKVKKNFATVPTVFTFPTGNGSQYAQFDAKGAKNSVVTVRYRIGTDNDEGYTMPDWWEHGGNCSNEGLSHVSDRENWYITSTSDLTNVTLHWDGSAEVHSFDNQGSNSDGDFVNNENISHLRIAYAEQGGFAWKNAGAKAIQASDNNSVGYIVSDADIMFKNNHRSLSPVFVTFASANKSELLLPIELLSFTADCDGSSAILNWTTASERNNDYFIVERSDDAVNFTEIARLQGAGNSINQNDYSYVDNEKNYGLTYYRLTQVDYDGQTSHSEIIYADCNENFGGDASVEVYPNPVVSDLSIEMHNFNGEPIRIEVIDVLGRVRISEKISGQRDYLYQMNLSDLPPATYQIRILNGDEVFVKSVVKNN